MDTAEPSRRPWLTHERLVLLVVAIVATLGLGYVGWQASIVRHRWALRPRMNCSVRSPLEAEVIREPIADRSLPIVRRLLGDQGVYFIVFDPPFTEDDRELIAEFPEATVFLRPLNWPTRIGL